MILKLVSRTFASTLLFSRNRGNSSYFHGKSLHSRMSDKSSNEDSREKDCQSVRIGSGATISNSRGIWKSVTHSDCVAQFGFILESSADGVLLLIIDFNDSADLRNSRLFGVRSFWLFEQATNF